jgi:hypothetical protein
MLASMTATAATLDAPRMPESMIGRYESEAKLCRIAWKRRNDGEEGRQGGGLLLVEARELYFSEWRWPVRAVQSDGKNAVTVKLANDIDGDGKNVQIKPIRLSVQGNVLIMADDTGTSRYFRCSKHHHGSAVG